MKVAFCVPSLTGPTAPFIEALERSIPAIEAAGWEHCAVEERGCPYISHARATMLRKALDAKADVIVFLDYDLSWADTDLLRLIEAEGHVVAGTYRFKKDEEEYMGALPSGADKRPIVRDDGCIQAAWVPAGFLKVTTYAIHKLMATYPELVYGTRFNPSFDLFNHGAHEGVWWGEDYAFSRRWIATGGEIWLIPDLQLDHHSKQPDGTYKAYPGNYHEHLCRRPGGSKEGQ